MNDKWQITVYFYSMSTKCKMGAGQGKPEPVKTGTNKQIDKVHDQIKWNILSKGPDGSLNWHCWVKDFEGKEANPVLIYKPQGIPQGDDLDFLLCLQTPLQSQLLKKLGKGKIICVDSTHGTNAYNFGLVTILVVDEFGEGYPVGWCLSNCEDVLVLEQFFRAIKQKTGPITPNWFMSDDADRRSNFWMDGYLLLVQLSTNCYAHGM